MKHTLVALCLVALPVIAQDDPTDELWQPGDDPRAAAALRERFRDRARIAAYVDIFTDIRNTLRTNDNWGTSPAERRVQRKLDDQLTTTIAQLNDTQTALGLAASTVEGATEFLVRGYTTERFKFDRVTKAWFDLYGEPPTNAVSLADLSSIPPSAATDFRYRVSTAHELLKELGSTAVAQTQKDIQLINARWELFLNKGPAQYPWESFINGLAIKTSFERPPAQQFIIVHPLPIVEVTNRSLDDLQADEAFAVEVLGYARYHFGMRNQTPTLRWWGISGTAGIHEDRSPSWGVLGHYNRTITAGVLWNDDETADDDPTIILGIDLYQLVQKKVPEYRDRLRAISAWRERLSN